MRKLPGWIDGQYEGQSCELTRMVKAGRSLCKENYVVPWWRRRDSLAYEDEHRTPKKRNPEEASSEIRRSMSLDEL